MDKMNEGGDPPASAKRRAVTPPPQKPGCHTLSLDKMRINAGSLSAAFRGRSTGHNLLAEPTKIEASTCGAVTCKRSIRIVVIR